MENLRRVDARSPSGSYLYPAHSLQDPPRRRRASRGRETVKPLAGSAAAAMQAWLTASGIQEGAFSRRIRKGGRLCQMPAPVAAPGGRAQGCVGLTTRTPCAPLAPGRKGSEGAARRGWRRIPIVLRRGCALPNVYRALKLRVEWQCSGARRVLGPRGSACGGAARWALIAQLDIDDVQGDGLAVAQHKIISVDGIEALVRGERLCLLAAAEWQLVFL
ncbi:hypothetical protein J2W96_005062 [Variovorax guangxiensis]|nr:hypothetical protein [Variovorax guangxiensis]